MGFIDGFFIGALTVMLLFMASVAVYNNHKGHATQAHDRPRGVPSVMRRPCNPWDLSV